MRYGDGAPSNVGAERLPCVGKRSVFTRGFRLARQTVLPGESGDLEFRGHWFLVDRNPTHFRLRRQDGIENAAYSGPGYVSIRPEQLLQGLWIGEAQQCQVQPFLVESPGKALSAYVAGRPSADPPKSPMKCGGLDHLRLERITELSRSICPTNSPWKNLHRSSTSALFISAGCSRSQPGTRFTST